MEISASKRMLSKVQKSKENDVGAPLRGDAPHAETFSQGGNAMRSGQRGAWPRSPRWRTSPTRISAAARVLDDMFAQMLAELMRR